ncbi:MAG: NAD(P)H-dependent flavin oxidoreductase [Acidimicrobiales bacterium]
MIRTRFTELFDIEHPIMVAPMAGRTGGALAAAVADAGGFGAFGGVTLQGPEWISTQVEVVRASTDRPFGIGFITPFIEMMTPLYEAALAAKPDVIALSFSDPRPWLGQAKDAGARVICQVQTLADADTAVEAGADVLVAQGNEAGGHTGTMGLLPFLAAVVARHPEVPVLAAGGIGDGRTLASALIAGADGAWLGTAFLATQECQIDEAYKDAVVASDGGDTVFTRAYDIATGLAWPAGIGERVQRSSFTDEWDERERDLRADPVKPSDEPLLYGQSAAFVPAVRTAADVVHQISADAERVLRERPGAILAG